MRSPARDHLRAFSLVSGILGITFLVVKIVALVLLVNWLFGDVQ